MRSLIAPPEATRDGYLLTEIGSRVQAHYRHTPGSACGCLVATARDNDFLLYLLFVCPHEDSVRPTWAATLKPQDALGSVVAQVVVTLLWSSSAC